MSLKDLALVLTLSILKTKGNSIDTNPVSDFVGFWGSYILTTMGDLGKHPGFLPRSYLPILVFYSLTPMFFL